MKPSRALPALTLALALAAPLGPAGAEDEFQRLDADQDGKITKEEFAAAYPDPQQAARDFKWYDRDQNGSISPDELRGTLKK